MCFRITGMKSTVLTQQALKGKTGGVRVGKGNILGAHEPRDNPTAVVSHADVLRGSSRQKNVRGGG